MKEHENISSYHRFYSALNFDRAGLFKLIKDEYGCATVLYPGSSIHITPSFYFQHLVYVDISEKAKEFFQDSENILTFVSSNKKYKQSALEDSSLRLEALIRRKGKKYHIEKGRDEKNLKALQGHRIPSKGMRNTSSGMEYRNFIKEGP